jgi:hypothetical protein
VYPELVTHGLDGKVETVRYSMLTPMLLNELQKQAMAQRRLARENEREAEQIRRLKAQVAATQGQIGTLQASFEQRLSTLERANTSGKLASAR